MPLRKIATICRCTCALLFIKGHATVDADSRFALASVTCVIALEKEVSKYKEEKLCMR